MRRRCLLAAVCLPLVFVVGVCRWCLPLVFVVGVCRWCLPLAFAVGACLTCAGIACKKGKRAKREVSMLSVGFELLGFGIDR
jgi:hypothetical protein